MFKIISLGSPWQGIFLFVCMDWESKSGKFTEENKVSSTGKELLTEFYLRNMNKNKALYLRNLSVEQQVAQPCMENEFRSGEPPKSGIRVGFGFRVSGFVD